MSKSHDAKMKNHNRPKSIAKDYNPSPFYFKEQRGANDMRLVVWSPDLSQMKEFFYQALRIFPHEVEVLLKIEKENKNAKDKWARYYGQLNSAELEVAIKRSEKLIFQDGGSQLNVKRQDSGEYLTLDEYGVIYVYSKSDQFEKLCRENGFKERVEKLISDLPHWHIVPGEAKRRRDKFIKNLHLKSVS